MERMSDAEWRTFVMTGTRTGKLAVPQADGMPHVTPIWFTLDEDDVVFTTAETGVKGKALARERRAAMCVDDQEPPYSYVLIQGGVSISLDLEEMLVWSTELARRYMGDALADEYGARNAGPGECLVRLRADKVIAYRAVAD